MSALVDFYILLILLLEVFLLAKIDRVVLGSWLTPFSVLAVPYVVVILLAVLIGRPIGYYPLYFPSILIWNVGLFAYWFSGFAITLPFRSAMRTARRRQHALAYEVLAEKLALLLSWIFIPFISLKLLNLLRSLGGFNALGSSEFSTAYGTGLSAHMVVFSYPILIFLIGIAERRKRFVIATIVILLGLIFVYQVKSWVIVPITGGILYRWWSGRIHIEARHMLIFVGGMVFVFFGSYLLTFSARDPSAILDPAVYSFLIQHFANYLFAGVLALSERTRMALSLPLSPSQVFAPFINLYSLLVGGDFVSQISSQYVQISETGRSSNVHTLFGTLLIALGTQGLLLYTVFLGIIVNATYVAGRMTRNCWVVVFWCYLAAMLAVGWFELYFWNLAAIEASVYCSMLGFIFWFMSRLSRQQRHKYGSDSSLLREL